jgi:dTDP-glucose 4,6-dehydratase
MTTMNWTGRRVLVTGAGGFIGSHLTEALVHAGAEVTAFVHYRSSQAGGLLSLLAPDARRAIRMVAGELRDADAIGRATRGQHMVFHLGALIAIPYSYRHPTDVVQTNVDGTLHALLAARDAGVMRFVHTSTSEVYGSAQRVPIDETHPISPQSPYAASKVGADALASSFQRSFGLPVATIRPFNCYGPRQSARAVIPTIVSQALHAGEVRIGSLSPTRDFTYVGDTVAGFMAVAGADDAVGRVFNVGSGKEISIGALADRIVRLTGRTVPIVCDQERVRPEASEVNRLVCDASLAGRLLGWSPAVGFDEGLRQVIDFMRGRPDWTRTGDYEV